MYIQWILAKDIQKGEQPKNMSIPLKKGTARLSPRGPKDDCTWNITYCKMICWTFINFKEVNQCNEIKMLPYHTSRRGSNYKNAEKLRDKMKFHSDHSLAWNMWHGIVLITLPWKLQHIMKFSARHWFKWAMLDYQCKQTRIRADKYHRKGNLLNNDIQSDLRFGLGRGLLHNGTTRNIPLKAQM